jgi:hypothetical protein
MCPGQVENRIEAYLKICKLAASINRSFFHHRDNGLMTVTCMKELVRIYLKRGLYKPLVHEGLKILFFSHIIRDSNVDSVPIIHFQ